ncbi:MAG: hypothetical protein ACPLRN_03665, partial [Microgenomates group bacterium]
MKEREKKELSPKQKVINALAVGVLGLSLLTGCGGDERHTPTPVAKTATPTATAIAIQLSTDWHVCTEIQPGEGVVAALRRAS